MVTKEEIDDICKKAIETWGALFQEDMWIKESSELTKAILKLRRTKTMVEVYEREDEVVKEIVDSELMLIQLQTLYVNNPRTQKLYKETMDYKINRLKDKLKGES